MDRLAIDTNAAIALFRPERETPPALHDATRIFVPLPVAGELFAGAAGSRRQQENRELVEAYLALHSMLLPNLDTARIYGTLRAAVPAERISVQKQNDLWIAALCLQHDLPLLTNDRGFDAIPNLSALHW